ncbi:lectin-like protein kinase [Musa troglodytarum]|uniref:Lectin-like protein kinase n=1 Tax=Musa troglodytarum TaxID=320322 RepID=A0A9E7HCL8_9LILI|nr:lectin-like protein kinase [Musa troglodytarum]
MKLGKGGFGEVYRGVLTGENKEVAVKKFSRGNSGQDDFLKELTIINRLRHKHRRYNVITGVASALHYLHDEYDQRVVHRDLKASNIMLDSNFNARLGDFGLARALETDKTSYAEIELGGVPGTLGYIAPECFHTGKATRESDVFGFGAVVLEVVCGRRPRCDIAGFKFLSDWVWKLHQEDRILDSVDPRLGDYVPEDAQRMLLLGLACSHPIPVERPTTQAMVQIVSRAVAPPVVPPFKPAFVWPSGPVEEQGDAGTSSRLTTSSAVTSSHHASSTERAPQCLSREGHVGPGDASSSNV